MVQQQAGVIRKIFLKYRCVQKVSGKNKDGWESKKGVEKGFYFGRVPSGRSMFGGYITKRAGSIFTPDCHSDY